ncbi:MAG: hypothetical protein AAF317_00075 [Pseudomonadota bacterium]
MSQRFSLPAQLSAVEAEIAMRRSVYPRQISKGKLRQSEADYKIANMEAVRKTLVWLIANEPDIRAWQADKKAAE